MSQTVFATIGGNEVPVIIEGGNTGVGMSIASQDLTEAVVEAKGAAQDADASAGAAQAAANAANDAVASVPGLISGKANTTGDNLNATDKEDFIGNLQVTKGGFWTDQAPGAVVWRAQDRFLFGDGVQYTGGRFGTGAGLGTDWLTTRGANYFAKNAQVMGLSTNAIAGMFGSWTPVGVGALINMGVGAVSLNEGTGSTGRAGYFEAFHRSETGVTVGVEIQGGNFTSVMPNPNAYGVGVGYHGIQGAVEAAHGYVTGNGNVPVAPPTMPAGVMLDISGGSIGAAYQRWTAGIVIRNGALYRSIDGLTGRGKAISMAQQHEIVWEANATLRGAVIRSDVAATAGTDVGVIFTGNNVTLTGASEAPIFRASHVASAVNFVTVSNGTTGLGPLVSFGGTDTNVTGRFQTKGTGAFSFMANGGEAVRISPPAATPVNSINLTASAANNPITIAAIGADTNIDIRFAPKGTGRLRFGTFAASADVAITGYVEIKTDDGTVRKLAVIA